jgi:hypothetical protein
MWNGAFYESQQEFNNHVAACSHVGPQAAWIPEPLTCAMEAQCFHDVDRCPLLPAVFSPGETWFPLFRVVGPGDETQDARCSELAAGKDRAAFA